MTTTDLEQQARATCADNRISPSVRTDAKPYVGDLLADNLRSALGEHYSDEAGIVGSVALLRAKLDATLTRPESTETLPNAENGDVDCPKAAASRSCACGFCVALRKSTAGGGGENLPYAVAHLVPKPGVSDPKTQNDLHWVVVRGVLADTGSLAAAPQREGG